MSETAIKAPKVNHWIFVLKDGKFVFDKKTLEAIDKVYAILEAVEPCGEDNRVVAESGAWNYRRL